jgi:hypothetical protein
MSAFEKAWSHMITKGLEDMYVDLTSDYVNVQNTGGPSGHGLSFDEVDQRIMRDFRNMGIDPQHFLDWKTYDPEVGSLIDDDPNSEAAQALRNSLDDLMYEREPRIPEMSGDPFRMKRPEIDSELEQMAAEMGRRKGRKDAVREDKMNEKDPGLHGLDEHLRQNYFKNLFDRENPQNKRLINATAPQIREREAALNAELKRRAEKRRSP